MNNYIIITSYFICVICYFEQASIFGINSNLGTFLILPLLVVNAFYCYKYLRGNDHNIFLNVCTIFLLLNFIYFYVDYNLVVNFSRASSLNFFKGVLLSLSCIYPTYYWSKNGSDYRILLLITSIFALFSIWQLRIYNITLEDTDEFTDNSAYSFLSLLPCVFLIRKYSILRLVFTGLIIGFVISCAKRGAIASLVVACLFVFAYLLRKNNGNLSVLKKAGLLFMISLLVYYGINQFLQNDFVQLRFEQLEESGGSSRELIYSNIWNNWTNSNLLEQLFGHGYCASRLMSGTGNFAHNDWLELLADMGIFGIGIYAWFMYSLLKCALKATNQNVKYMLLTIFTIWLTKTLFSMSYMDENNFILSILIGYALPRAYRSPKSHTNNIYKHYEYPTTT